MLSLLGNPSSSLHSLFLVFSIYPSSSSHSILELLPFFSFCKAFSLPFHDCFAFLKRDAAHTIHPLAGQGGNLGFSDVQDLVETLGSGIRTGQDIGSLHLLQSYERKRMVANVTMMAAVDFLKRFYESELGPVVTLRHLGLLVSNNTPLIKDEFVRFAING